MNFFVYTLAKQVDGNHVVTRTARSDYVNAQPLREILSMMTMVNGRMVLHLPRLEGAAHPAQGGASGFLVNRWIIVDDPAYALLLTAKKVEDFEDQCPSVFSPERAAEVVKRAKLRQEAALRDYDYAEVMAPLAELFGGVGKKKDS